MGRNGTMQSAAHRLGRSRVSSDGTEAMNSELRKTGQKKIRPDWVPTDRRRRTVRGVKARARTFHDPLRNYDVCNDPNPVTDRSVFRMDLSGTTNRVRKADGDSDYLPDCRLPPRAVYRKREANRLFSPNHGRQLLQHTSGQTSSPCRDQLFLET